MAKKDKFNAKYFGYTALTFFRGYTEITSVDHFSQFSLQTFNSYDVNSFQKFVTMVSVNLYFLLSSY